MPDDDLLLPKVQNFLDSFEMVFYYDWYFTKDFLEDIPRNENFLSPALTNSNPCSDGANYENLLNAYRDLKAFLISEGIHPNDLIETKVTPDDIPNPNAVPVQCLGCCQYFKAEIYVDNQHWICPYCKKKNYQFSKEDLDCFGDE